jgi:hypothetical protein
MSNVVQPFVSQNLPEFISSDNPKFKLFIEAYYEYLEKRNDSEALNVKEMFKAIDNPMAVVNNSNDYKDVDNTLDNFLDYFKREVLPIAIKTNAVTDRFLIKKIRDVYLAKGSPKSFELLFRMLYDQEIDIVETRDNILEASEGKFLAFPLVTFKVTQFSEKLTNINFTLASLTHSDDNFVTDSEVATCLSGQILGKTADSDKAFVISLQVNFAFEPDSDSVYRITDPDDSTIFLEVTPFLSLVDLVAKNNAPGYSEGDVIKVKSKSLNKSFNVIVDSVNNGPVTGLHFRDRGEFFNVGDSFILTPSSPADGSGGSAVVTEVDNNGRILSVDGYALRTGVNNNGFLADDFENVTVPIINGGSYNKLPDATINNGTTTIQALPYARSNTSGQGPQFSPISTEIGTIANLNINDRGYFADANDIVVEAPMNVTIEGYTRFVKGQLVSFQYIDQKNQSFFNDSDRLDISIKVNKTVDGNSKYNVKSIKLPFDFDSELFQWTDSDFMIDSDHGLSLATAKWKTLTGRHLNIEVIDDSDLGFKARLSNKFLNGLDSYHFNQLNNYTFNDSDYIFNWRNDFRDPKLGVDSEVAEWRNTGYFGIVSRINSNKRTLSISSVSNRLFPSDSDLRNFDIVKNRILRIVAFNPSTDSPVVREKQILANILTNYNRASFTPVLSSFGSSTRTFINEDGFLNSSSGGVVQDNYLYSSYTYIIQSNLSVDIWRNKIKETLHPAGLLMFGETNLNANSKVPLNITVASDVENYDTNFTFDTALDHYSDVTAANRVTADNTRYEANAFLFYKQNLTSLNALTASSFERGYDEAIVSEYGSSWFDYEPMGLVRKEKVNYDNFYNNYYNFDSEVFNRAVSTQDSDGSSYVKALTMNYKKYDGTVQDLYKKESRTRSSYSPVKIVSTKFVDPINDLYSIYDSDIPLADLIRWSDSEDKTFKAIDYNKLKSVNDTRTFKWYNTDRKKEMKFKMNIDLNKAMRLDGTLKFTEQDGTVYENLEAYEKIWNTANSYRQDSDGWEINGYSSFVQNMKIKPRKLYVKYAERRPEEYSKVKTPFKLIVWDNTDSDNILWNTHYQTGEDAVLNNSVGAVFDFYSVNERANIEEWRDPITSMKGRKVK